MQTTGWLLLDPGKLVIPTKLFQCVRSIKYQETEVSSDQAFLSAVGFMRVRKGYNAVGALVCKL